MSDLVVALLAGTVTAATPLVFAALGELIAEKSGVLNLGVEGMMLMGAIAAFAGATGSGSLALGVVCGAVAGAGMAALFGVLALTLLANQVATGLALTILGAGLSAFVGQRYVSLTLTGMQPIAVPGLSQIPLLGPVLFTHDMTKMARGEPCTTVYIFEPATKGPAEEITSFHCIPNRWL
jgi:simple sugar transport system permease protein